MAFWRDPESEKLKKARNNPSLLLLPISYSSLSSPFPVLSFPFPLLSNPKLPLLLSSNISPRKRCIFVVVGVVVILLARPWSTPVPWQKDSVICPLGFVGSERWKKVFPSSEGKEGKKKKRIRLRKGG